MALLNTDLLSAHDQTFRQDRYLFEQFLQEGVGDGGDYKVTAGGASLQWSVAAGTAWVRGDDTTRQGLYPQINDAAVTGLVAAGHATLPRIDQVILQVADSSVAGVSDTPTLSTLAGTATSGATLDNRTGAAALPSSALRFADILVPAAHTGVLVAGTHIRDRRPFARGFHWYEEATSGDLTTTATTAAGGLSIFTGGDIRLETSGALLVLEVVGIAQTTGTAAAIQSGFSVDAATPPVSYSEHVTASNHTFYLLRRLLTLSAGSHLINARIWGTTAGTTTLFRSAAVPLRFRIFEDLRDTATNSGA